MIIKFLFFDLKKIKQNCNPEIENNIDKIDAISSENNDNNWN